MTLRQVFQLNLSYLQKSQLIDRMQSNEELECNCILLVSEQDHFEQKYDFSANEAENFVYSGFSCKVSEWPAKDREDLPKREFVSGDWDYFKLRVFSLLFASQSLVYDVVDNMLDEASSCFPTEQQRDLYFYAFMGRPTNRSLDRATVEIGLPPEGRH